MAKTISRSTPAGRLARLARSRGITPALYGAAHGVAARRPLAGWLDLEVVELFRCDLSELRSSTREPSLYAVRLARADDLPLLEAFFSKPGTVRDRLSRGDTCLMALADGEICAAVWWMLGPGSFQEDRAKLGCVFGLPPSSCWAYDAKGVRLGAFGSLMLCQRPYLDRLGAKVIWGRTDYANKTALATNEALGFESTGRILHLSLAGRHLTRHRNVDGHWRSLPVSIGDLQVHDANPRGGLPTSS